MAKELNGVRTASQWWAKGGVCVCRLRLWKYHSADMGTLIPRASSVLSNAVEGPRKNPHIGAHSCTWCAGGSTGRKWDPCGPHKRPRITARGPHWTVERTRNELRTKVETLELGGCKGKVRV